MAGVPQGICDHCGDRVPADHAIREGRVYLLKQCPKCGSSEALVSNDAATWQTKRSIWGGWEDKPATACKLNCDRCNILHKAQVVFIDVTNRCNMNCPICIANVKSMGFDFHPPLSYFENIFRRLSELNPKPMVELFGGEPTMHDNLLEIVHKAREFGIKTRIVTNGLRLADEEYCHRLCEAGVRFRVAFDGRNPEICSRLRKCPDAYEKKLKAIENLKKHARRRSAILCCAARRINEDHMADLIDYCHENIDAIDTIGLIPLAEKWEPGTFETDVQTTREDAEHMIERAVRGGGVEFIPAGLLQGLRTVRSFFRRQPRSETLMLGGTHPDCETMTLLVSNGQHYIGPNNYLKMPFRQVAEDLLARCRRIEGKLKQLDPERPLQRLRGQIVISLALLPFFRRTFDLRKLFKGNPVLAALKVAAGFLVGQKPRDLGHKYMNPPRILRVVVLPFEEHHSLDSSRMENCVAVFAYEDPQGGQIKTVPVCAWTLYRNEILRNITERYAETGSNKPIRLPVLTVNPVQGRPPLVKRACGDC